MDEKQLGAMLDLVKDGGVWGIPMSGNVVQVWRAEKRIAVLSGGNNKVMRDMKEALKKIGWKLRLATTPTPQARFFRRQMRILKVV